MKRSSALAALWLAAALVWPGTGAGGRERHAGSAVLQAAGTGLGTYRGLGTWVDIYDSSPYDRPGPAVRRMAERGVKTLYLETANYRITTKIHRPADLSRLIEAAHARQIKVVAWYLPSFDNLRKDFRRSMAAIRFKTANSQTFDSFALDIEATVVRDISLRNERAKRLVRRIRNAVGNRYKMGAIVPEANALYWPNFPYRAIARQFNVFLPMAYFTYRTSGYNGVYEWVSKNIRVIRAETSNADIPIHVIGGVSQDATAREARAFVQATNDRRVMGASMYDFLTTTPRQWKILRSVPS